MNMSLFTHEALNDGNSAPLGSGCVDALNEQNAAKITGLQFLRDFISGEQERWLFSQIDVRHDADWLADLQRRVQHYGYRYDYKSRRIAPDMQVGPLPPWLVSLGGLLVRRGIFTETPDQVIVNEYLPGQGISRHIDCVPCFEGVIASLSLGSSCVMEYDNPLQTEKIPLLLKPRSLVVMKGDARYVWRHSIPARQSDTFAEITTRRERRISLTFRRVILENQ